MDTGADFETARQSTRDLAEQYRTERRWAIGLGVGALALAIAAVVRIVRAKSIKAKGETVYRSTGQELPPHEKFAPPPTL